MAAHAAHGAAAADAALAAAAAAAALPAMALHMRRKVSNDGSDTALDTVREGHFFSDRQPDIWAMRVQQQ